MTCLMFLPAEIQPKFSIHMPEKLATVYERKISLNQVPENIVTESIELTAEIIANNIKYQSQILDEISAIHGEISATLLPSELAKVPIYNEASPTATVIGQTMAHNSLQIIRIENGFAKIEITPEAAGWIQNRYILSADTKKLLYAKQTAIRRHLENELGLQRVILVERRPWATTEYLSFGTGLGLCALGLFNPTQKETSYIYIKPETREVHHE